MHAIKFPNSGYITSIGLDKAPDPNTWQHPIWTMRAFETEAQRVFSADANRVPASLLAQVRTFYERHQSDLAITYQVPHFTHGDCHASQFYLVQQAAGFTVTGVLDMEVASAGDCLNDFVKFCIEAAGLFPYETAWWDDLFTGYGHTPEFNQVKLRMLYADHHNYNFIWQGTRATILQHLYDAQSWSELFHLPSAK
jgi:aminoglycoside phosphotransferase (APT) family kinase protein